MHHQTMLMLMQSQGGIMRTTVTLDDELLAKAEQLCGHLERSALLREAPAGPGGAGERPPLGGSGRK